MSLPYRDLLRLILRDYRLPANGHHGVSHWARVLENGVELASHTGANVGVVRLFAVFHDARRENEALDLGHGRRGADFAASLFREGCFELPEADFDLLYRACALHTDGLVQGDITLLTCWDADRLDLGRVGIAPRAELLGTVAARQSDFMRRAGENARARFVPDRVRTEWAMTDLFPDPGSP